MRSETLAYVTDNPRTCRAFAELTMPIRYKPTCRSTAVPDSGRNLASECPKLTGTIAHPRVLLAKPPQSAFCNAQGRLVNQGVNLRWPIFFHMIWHGNCSLSQRGCRHSYAWDAIPPYSCCSNSVSDLTLKNCLKVLTPPRDGCIVLPSGKTFAMSFRTCS